MILDNPSDPHLTPPSSPSLRPQTLKSRDSPPNVLFAGDDVRDVVGALRSNAGQTGRTETTDTTASPEFTNRAFVLAVPRDSAGPLANKLHDGGKDGADLNAELGSSGPPALHCQLFAASSSLSSARNEDVLIGEGFVDFFGMTVEVRVPHTGPHTTAFAW